ncbi:MAG: LysR family transcriptional regulator [Polyangiales bacterium]
MPRAPVSLDAVAIFVEVVKAKSFSEAARRLQLPKSTVSVRVAELETRLGIALLHRTTRKVTVTPAGEAYFVTAARSIAELQAAELEAAQAQAEPSGRLRITAPGADTGHVGDRIAEFLARHPRVSIELVMTDRKVDMLAENIDVAFRIGTLGDAPNLTARRIGYVHRALYASPDYLREHKPPTHPRELAAHALLLGKVEPELSLARNDGARASVRLQARFIANHPAGLRQQALRGHGIALLPSHMGDEDVRSSALRRVLPDWTTPSVPVSIVFPKQRYLPQRVRLFVDHVMAHEQRRTKQRSSS